MRTLAVLFSIFLALATSAFASGFQLAGDLMLEVELPSQHWKTATTPPEPIVRLIAGGDGPALQEKTRRKLAANELFIWNPASNAYLMIDVSALKEGEPVPSDHQILLSAQYAGSALESEDGLSQVRHSNSGASLRGVRVAYRLDAWYNRQNQPHRFVGLIGFSQPYWIYAYYNDPMVNEQDLKEMEVILTTLRFHRNVAN